MRSVSGEWLPRPRAHARTRQRGQALIEFTFFFTFMMLILAGVTDVAFLVDAHVNVVYAARQGARTGSVLGQGSGTFSPDCAIVGAVHATLLNQSDVTLQQIIIYKADANGQDTLGQDQVYQGGDYCTSPTTWALGGPAGGGTWPPSQRNITAFSEDSIGVKLVYQYQFRFDLWQGGTLNLTDSAVFPMNVNGLQTPAPTPM